MIRFESLTLTGFVVRLCLGLLVARAVVAVPATVGGVEGGPRVEVVKAGAFSWLWDKVKSGFVYLGETLASMATWVWDVGIKPALDALWDGLKKLLQLILNALLAVADSLGLNWDKAAMITAWDSLWTMVKDFSWVLPLGTVMGMWLSAFGTVLVIRGVRFVWGLVWANG